VNITIFSRPALVAPLGGPRPDGGVGARWRRGLSWPGGPLRASFAPPSPRLRSATEVCAGLVAVLQRASRCRGILQFGVTPRNATAFGVRRQDPTKSGRPRRFRSEAEEPYGHDKTHRARMDFAEVACPLSTGAGKRKRRGRPASPLLRQGYGGLRRTCRRTPKGKPLPRHSPVWRGTAKCDSLRHYRPGRLQPCEATRRQFASWPAQAAS